jgi:hypothetical protein
MGNKVHDVSIEERGGEVMWWIWSIVWVLWWTRLIHLCAARDSKPMFILAPGYLFGLVMAFLFYMAGQS